MMRNWVEPHKVTIPAGLENEVGGHRLLSQLLVQRGITDVDAARAFLDSQYYRPTPPGELAGMEKAVERIEKAIQIGEIIGVWGDFDVDGQTATALLVSALRGLGGKVEYHIPIRERESHGINLPRLKPFLDGGVGLLITCDTGISEHEAVNCASKRGVDVVITDHHELPPRLPKAYAILNPKLLPSSSPLANLPGVGVAFKLVEALYQNAGHAGVVDSYLDLVALGIVADVAIQVGDTRYLLQRGLDVLRDNQRVGLQVMMELADLQSASLSEEHIGFVIAPRLNSLGRLADANPAVEFLITQDINKAKKLGEELESLNARRRLLTDQVFQAAQTQIEKEPTLLSQAALVLSHQTWPAGVIGIVAGRLAERYQKPAVLISEPPSELTRGSARSVEGCDIFEAISSCRELLTGFGGHSMAAGFSLEAELIPDFRRALSAVVQSMLGEVISPPKLIIDGYYELGDLAFEFVKELERLSPFGPGNPAPILVSTGLTVKQFNPIGRNYEHLRVLVEDKYGQVNKVIWWNGAGWKSRDPLENSEPFDLAYVVRTSDYRGQSDIQIEWVDIRPAETAQIEVNGDQLLMEVHDFRGEPDPLDRLKGLLEENEPQIWCEGLDRRMLANLGIKSSDREELTKSNNLVIWTTPAGRNELMAAIDKVSPSVISLIAVEPQNTQVEPFLRYLAGLCKYAINHTQGKVKVALLAAATSQSKATVRLGISWLEKSGFLAVMNEEAGELSLAKGKQTAVDEHTYLLDQLKELLAETAAYRAFFSTADVDSLLPTTKNPTNQLRGATG
ncbi:MAG: single-stranded-DNA-specific exonuclease RecJ [Anaerolineales bacterium]|nr:single-stranded-DNA-specific exonuclease RecJ [Anaerolineales bacterium]